MTPIALADWLADSGLRNLPLEEMVDGFSRRLNDIGVPVARTFVGMNDHCAALPKGTMTPPPA